MALKNVNALTHYTDYTIGHVHMGALAWNGGLSFAMLYYIIPQIYRTALYSVKLANLHFWAATLGIMFYVLPMYALRSVGGGLYITGALLAVINLWATARQGSLWASEDDRAAPLVQNRLHRETSLHRRLEGRPTQFALLTLVAVLVGGIIEYVPTAFIESNIPTIAAVKPYTPLELEGRDIYIAEGCNGCHS